MTADPPSDRKAPPPARLSTRPHLDESDSRNGSDPFTEDEKMLLALRDELYEGRWDLFETDLRARLQGQPHVFQIGPVSAHMKETIKEHLRIIDQLKIRAIG